MVLAPSQVVGLGISGCHQQFLSATSQRDQAEGPFTGTVFVGQNAADYKSKTLRRCKTDGVIIPLRCALYEPDLLFRPFLRFLIPFLLIFCRGCVLDGMLITSMLKSESPKHGTLPSTQPLTSASPADRNPCPRVRSGPFWSHGRV